VGNKYCPFVWNEFSSELQPKNTARRKYRPSAFKRLGGYLKQFVVTRAWRDAGGKASFEVAKLVR